MKRAQGVCRGSPRFPEKSGRIVYRRIKMSRVQLIQKAQATDEVKEIFNKMEAHGARILNLYRVLAHSPEVMRNFVRLGNSLLSKAKLSPKLRELAILRVAKLTGSQYEWAHHYYVALEAGLSQEQAEAVANWNESTKFSDEERAVLQYTDEVAQKVQVKETTFNKLRQFFDEQTIVELTLSIGYWGMLARLLVSLQVDIDMGPSSAKELTGHKS